MKTNAGNLKKGDFIVHEGKIWQVVKTEFSFHGRGMAVMRAKIKSVESGKNVDVTYKTVENIELADVESKQMQFLYEDAGKLHFMDEETFNQLSVNKELVGDVSRFFKEGEKYYIYLYDGKALNVRPPASIKLKVTQTQEGAKGDTVSSAKKPATVETGVTVMVPLFIKADDVIAINPETGEYVERVKV